MANPEIEPLFAAPEVVHGQDDAIMGLVLALLAREHAYLRVRPAAASRRSPARWPGRRAPPSSPSIATRAR
jgi:hypothetical protein